MRLHVLSSALALPFVFPDSITTSCCPPHLPSTIHTYIVIRPPHHGLRSLSAPLLQPCPRLGGALGRLSLSSSFIFWPWPVATQSLPPVPTPPLPCLWRSQTPQQFKQSKPPRHSNLQIPMRTNTSTNQAETTCCITMTFDTFRKSSPMKRGRTLSDTSFALIS